MKENRITFNSNHFAYLRPKIDSPSSRYCNKLADTLEKRLRGLSLVDYPGHPSLRYPLASLYRQARAVLFVVDSFDEGRLLVAAQQLYEILTDEDFVTTRAPILVVINKTDLITQLNPTNPCTVIDNIESKLCQHLDTIRGGSRNRSSADMLLGAESAKVRTLGNSNKGFRFQDSPCKVSFCTLSLVNATKSNRPLALELQPLLDFLASC